MNFARISRGLLLASIRVDKARADTSAAFIDRQGYAWWHIRLAPKSMLVCSCGGTVKDDPNTGEIADDWEPCSHIQALYDGQLTEDSRKAALGVIPRAIRGDVHLRWLVRLTERGGKMFRPRWVAKALTS